MKDKSMKSAFTLVELLAVVTILAVLGLIVIQTVNHSIDNSCNMAYDAQVKKIIDAAKQWSSKNASELPDIGDTEYYNIDIYTLINEGYISNLKDDFITNPCNDEVMNGCVSVKYSNEYNQYIFQYSEVCGIIDNISSPNISLIDTTLVIENNSSSVQAFDIYVDGVKKQNILIADQAMTENTVSGVWLLKDDVDSVLTDFSENIKLTASVISTIDGLEYYVMVDNISMDSDFQESYLTTRVKYSKPFFPEEFNIPYGYDVPIYYNGWRFGVYGNEITRWNFGSEPQQVSNEFYNWIINNGVKYTSFDLTDLDLSDGAHTITVRAKDASLNESIDSNSLNYVVNNKTNLVSGIWELNETLTLPENPFVEDIDATCKSILNGVEITSYGDTIYVNHDSVMVNITSSEKNTNDVYPFLATAYTSDSGWLTNNYGNGMNVWNFGVIGQEVSSEFYNWLITNATRTDKGNYWTYNNASLPQLPNDVDTSLYPYVMISKLANTGGNYGLAFTNKVPTYKYYEGIVHDSFDDSITQYSGNTLVCENGVSLHYYVLNNNEWVYARTYNESNRFIDIVSEEYIWSNVDIYNEDGSIFLKGTEPVR